MKGKEKKQLCRERIDKFAALSAKDKWQFFKDYYLKSTIIFLAVLIMLLSLCRDIWRGTRESIFYALVINSHTAVPDSFRDDFISYAGLDEKKYNIVIDSTMQMDLDRMDTMTSNYMQEIMAIASTREQDIFLADEQITKYYWEAEYIVDIREMLPEAFWRTYEDHFYYLPDPAGNSVPVGILVSDSPRLAAHGIYQNQQAILSVVYQAPDIEAIQSFIAYLYTDDMVE